MSRFGELVSRRSEQLELAERIATNTANLRQMSDEDVRLHNLYDPDLPISSMLEIEGLKLGEIYRFCLEEYRETGLNLLHERLNSGTDNTLLWSFSEVKRLIDYRKLTEGQYACLESAAKACNDSPTWGGLNRLRKRIALAKRDLRKN